MVINKGKPKRHSVELSCSPSAKRFLSSKPVEKLRRATEKLLRAADVSEARLSIVLLSETDIRRLNRKYLGHDHVTDVVTFDLSRERGAGSREKEQGSGRRKQVEGQQWELGTTASTAPSSMLHAPCFIHGEIYICPVEARRNALKYGEPFERELLRYVAHGILHLLGWRDQTDKLRAVMRKKENELLDVLTLKKNHLK